MIFFRYIPYRDLRHPAIDELLFLRSKLLHAESSRYVGKHLTEEIFHFLNYIKPDLRRDQIEKFSEIKKELNQLRRGKTAPASEIFERMFTQSIGSSVGSNFSSYSKPRSGKITVSKKGLENGIDISLASNRIKLNRFEEKLAFSLPKNATYFESPLITNYIDSLIYSQTSATIAFGRKQHTMFSKKIAQAHQKDLAMKLVSSKRIGNKKNELVQKIENIIGGKFAYNEKERDFLFHKDNEVYGSVSTAMGIKSLGIITLIAQAGLVGDDNVLILDEPEVHLHPNWQLKLAEVLVSASKNSKGTILISSHSPYFIEAIDAYAHKYKIRDDINFYNAVKGKDNYTSFKDCSDDISPIINNLAEPFKEIDRIFS